jgi:predicted RNA-binding Zn ribbon-like protein
MDIKQVERYSQLMLDRAALELINSLTPEGEDLLHDRDWAAESFRRWELEPHEPTEAELAELGELRSMLRRLAGTVSEARLLSPSQLAELNAVISAPVRAELRILDGAYFVEMTPDAGTWIEAAVRELAGSFSSMLRHSHPPRLRLCANEACRVAYYDESRSRTRRWCDPSGCGNRARVRRHRARRAA